MARFQVDPEVLGEAANRLDRYRARLDELTACAAAGDLGDARLSERVSATESAIARDVAKAAESVAGMARVVREAGGTYRGVDDAVRAAASGGSAPASTAP